MIIRKNKLSVFLFLLIACNSDPVDDPIPYVAFPEIVINLSFPDYQSLQQDKGYKLINTAGVRGIVVYRSSASIYIAYERNCTFQPNNACATVDVHSSGLFLTDTCCSSTFNFSDGNPSGGPAWRPLRRYRTQLNGTTLTITDEIIN